MLPILLSACAAAKSTESELPDTEWLGFDFAGSALTKKNLSGGANYVSMSEADAGPLDVEVARVGANVSLSHRIQPGLRLSYRLAAERSEYDIRGLALAVPGADPKRLETLDFYRLSVSLLHFSSLNLFYFGGLNVTVGQEPGSDLGESASLSVQAGIRYSLSELLFLTAGLAGASRLEGERVSLPFVGLAWHASEDWTFNLGVPSTGVTYHPTDEFSLALRTRFDFRDYRLDDTGVLNGAVFRDRTIALELGADWQLADSFAASVSVGIPVNRELSIDNSAGVTVATLDADEQPYFGVTLRLNP